jgi:dolichyl-phosphate-mannose-protein mannosyltransferase
MAKPAKSSNASVPAKAAGNLSTQAIAKKHDDYTSDGVVDTDVFLLPGSDYQVMIVVTVLAAVVRLFRIYQPSSVVFDEVQYDIPLQPLMSSANQSM